MSNSPPPLWGWDICRYVGLPKILVGGSLKSPPSPPVLKKNLVSWVTATGSFTSVCATNIMLSSHGCLLTDTAGVQKRTWNFSTCRYHLQDHSPCWRIFRNSFTPFGVLWRPDPIFRSVASGEIKNTFMKLLQITNEEYKKVMLLWNIVLNPVEKAFPVSLKIGLARIPKIKLETDA